MIHRPWASPHLRTILTVCSIVILAISSLPGRIQAQDPLELEGATGPVNKEDWGLAITPYAWFAAQASDVDNATLRQSFNDLASITNIGFQARLLARYKWVTFNADWTYADQRSGAGIGRTSVDIQLNQHILDMKVGGKVHDSRTSAQDGGVGIWVAGGARYWDNNVDLTITTQPIIPSNDPSVDTVQTGQTWWDPVLGLAFHWPVTPKVSFAVRATGGGLGIGNASTYMWDAEFTALFQLSRRFLLSAGYRSFKYDRKDSEGEEEVRQKVTVMGPTIGLSFGIF